ncbi:MAG TPA: polyprenyl synthetase family protein [Chloroflexota bacterium]|jgi:geranylgeranyl diphosphate synthase type I
MTADLDQQLTRLGELTDSWLRDAVARHISPAAERLSAMLEYHLGWRGPDLQPLSQPAPSGKKLRPALVLLVSQAVRGEIAPAARQAAAAVELIHNFSLVHDDIQDHSALRRHRPTVWSLWGMPQGINVGDALFALAQVVLSEAGTDLAAQLTFELNKTALGLAEGQFLDIDLQEGRTPPTLEVYETMVRRKTGLLFACACRVGAMAANASAASRDAYAAYGLELGIAFQEQDDLLGVWGLAAETGKPDAADIVERKRGLPAAMALSEPDAPAWLREVYDRPETELSTETIARIIAYFDQLGLQPAIERRVEARYRHALAYLAEAGAREPARGYLAAICDVLISRRT